jgi:uncharacterized protein
MAVSKKIMIITETVQMEAELNESKTAALIWEALPISAEVSTWGDEVYFTIPVKTGPENAVSVVQKGDLAYWPEGNCFCIFFGKTPASTEREIKPASPVNLVGRFSGDPELWKKVAAGDMIRLEAVKVRLDCTSQYNRL